MKQMSRPDRIMRNIRIVFFAIFIPLMYWLFFWEGDTTEIKAKADELKTEPGWRMMKNRVQPDIILCSNGFSCPSVSRVWDTGTGKPLPGGKFAELIERSGWKTASEIDDCPRDQSSVMSPEYIACSADIRDGRWKIRLVDSSRGQISLLVEE